MVRFIIRDIRTELAYEARKVKLVASDVCANMASQLDAPLSRVGQRLLVDLHVIQTTVFAHLRVSQLLENSEVDDVRHCHILFLALLSKVRR
jgi:hypothetical protein